TGNPRSAPSVPSPSRRWPDDLLPRRHPERKSGACGSRRPRPKQQQHPNRPIGHRQAEPSPAPRPHPRTAAAGLVPVRRGRQHPGAGRTARLSSRGLPASPRPLRGRGAHGGPPDGRDPEGGPAVILGGSPVVPAPRPAPRTDRDALPPPEAVSAPQPGTTMYRITELERLTTPRRERRGFRP